MITLSQISLPSITFRLQKTESHAVTLMLIAVLSKKNNPNSECDIITYSTLAADISFDIAPTSQ